LETIDAAKRRKVQKGQSMIKGCNVTTKKGDIITYKSDDEFFLGTKPNPDATFFSVISLSVDRK